jgi:hypothetical protein
MTLKIVEHDPETVEYFLDGTSIVTATHDDLGWEGMDVLDSALRTMAELLDIDVIETTIDDEEDVD